MIVVMKKNADEETITAVATKVDSLGLRSNVIVGEERTVVAAIGEERNGHQETLASLPGVEKVVPILAPYKVASRERDALNKPRLKVLLLLTNWIDNLR